ncbi:MAG TPA: hypothetical protein VFX30_00040 [bacterium]|nr:hypothetical protein [bacterium]
MDVSLPALVWRAAAAPFLTDVAGFGEAAESAFRAFESGDVAGFARDFGRAGFAFARVHARLVDFAVTHARLTSDAVPEESFWEKGARLLWPSRDPERLAADHNLMASVPFEERDVLWSRTLASLRAGGKDLPWDKIRTYDGFIRYLYDAGIRYPQRIRSVETAVTLAENRAHPERLGRDCPIAIVLSNQADGEGSFEASEYPTLDVLVSGGYDVVYFETGRDVDGLQFMERVVGASERRISLAVFSGHGDGKGIALGAGRREEASLDINDFRSRGFGPYLDRLLAPDADIFLDACATGEGDDNVGLAIAQSVPGRTVHGTRIDNRISRLEFKNGRFSRVVWEDGQGYVAKFQRS